MYFPLPCKLKSDFPLPGILSGIIEVFLSGQSYSGGILSELLQFHILWGSRDKKMQEILIPRGVSSSNKKNLLNVAPTYSAMRILWEVQRTSLE
jgi:hypothetical protein